MDVLKRTLDTSERRGNQEKNGVQMPTDNSFIAQNTAAVSVSNITPTSAFVDHNLQYRFLPESGGAQAIIQNSFPNGGGATSETPGGESRLAFLPTASINSATATGGALQPTNHTLPHTGGQFYLMMSSPDVLQPGVSCTIAPRTQTYAVKMEAPRAPRDDRRRAQHNEVERRRRDKINNWIVTLSTIMPDCNVDSTKSVGSKGEILSKACDYIQELRQHNQHLQASLNEVKRVQMENEVLRQQVEDLKNENVTLRAKIQQHRMNITPEMPSH